uniref:Uncharacterized protein n=1 Tax=Colletotrichum fructicola (strain Nara gc5) TaxID=1213859 RepID=L2FKX1_COLFN
MHILTFLSLAVFLSPRSVFASAVRDNTSPSPAFSAPFLQITPAPDPSHVSRRLHLLKARQGPPRSPDGTLECRFGAKHTLKTAGQTTTSLPTRRTASAARGTRRIATWRRSAEARITISQWGRAGRLTACDSGPTKTCDTITVLQTKGSDDARRIIFCIAKSDQYVLPMTWYRVTFPLLEATVTVTESTTVTAIIQGGSSARGSDGSVHPPPYVRENDGIYGSQIKEMLKRDRSELLRAKRCSIESRGFSVESKNKSFTKQKRQYSKQLDK